MKLLIFGALFFALSAVLMAPSPASRAGGDPELVAGDYKLLDPITHGNLTVFPVVSARSHDTTQFLTLDEGIHSGEVVITEVGNLHTMVRRRPIPNGFVNVPARVNSLVLVNNSERPLILLAGEIVTGGKQDRVVGKDRIVPAESDPIDLGVFCVEPHRWVETSLKFDSHASVMAQPSVRKKAMAEKNQEQVWAEVGKAKNQMADNLRAAASASPQAGSGGGVGGGAGSPGGGGASTTRVEVTDALLAVQGTSSYAEARANKVVEKQIESITEPMQKSYESLIKQLRNRNAVGVVVAVKGRIVWADLFASPALLSKYWPKLLQSYAAEALTTPGDHRDVSLKEAQQFLDDWQARHETVESEPGLYRQRELVGDRFRAFELTSLLPKASFDVHLSKMAQ